MKGLGRTIICMDREFIRGVMEGSTRGSTTWIKNMVMEYTIGLMEGNMKVTGTMESNMGRGSI